MGGRETGAGGADRGREAVEQGGAHAAAQPPERVRRPPTGIADLYEHTFKIVKSLFTTVFLANNVENYRNTFDAYHFCRLIRVYTEP